MRIVESYRALLPLQTDWTIGWSISFMVLLPNHSIHKFISFSSSFWYCNDKYFAFPFQAILLFNILFSHALEISLYGFFISNVVVEWDSKSMEKISKNQNGSEKPECTNHSIWQEPNDDANTDSKSARSEF